MPDIPAQEFVSEAVTGAIFRQAATYTLVVGLDDLVGDLIIRGEVILRYGLPTLRPPIRYIIPGLFAGERGGTMVGRQAWRYMQARWEHHPRADVFGVAPDGTPVNYFLKELDLSVPIRVFAYPNPNLAAMVALCPVDSLRAAPEVTLPELLRASLGRQLPE